MRAVKKLTNFGLVIYGLLSCVLFQHVSADSFYRAYYSQMRLDLVTRLQQLGVHGHIDIFGKNKLGLYIPTDSISPQCQEHSQLYLKGVEQYERWALEMLDSSGKVPSGLFNGNVQDLGNFEQCLESVTIAPYNVQYCALWIKNLHKLPDTEEDSPPAVGGVDMFRPYLEIGICLPASCKKADIMSHYNNMLTPYNMSIDLNKYACTVANERDPLTYPDIFFLIILAVTVTLGIAGSYLSIFNPNPDSKPGSLAKLLSCFSFYGNAKSLITLTSSKEPLMILHGMKCISALWVMLAHAASFMFIFPMMNMSTALKFVSDRLTSMVMVKGELAVDSFFFITGVLVFYMANKSLKKGTRFYIPYFYFSRFIRLAPAYYMHILIILTVVRYMNGGPMWKYHVLTPRDNCYKSWPYHLIFANNFINTEEQCTPTDWYVAIDMQLHILAPLLMIPLFKSRKWMSHFLLPFIILVGSLALGAVTYINNFPATFMNDRLSFRPKSFTDEYVLTYLRFTPYAIGILTGYILSKGKLKISKTLAWLGWLVTSSLLGVVLWMSWYVHQETVLYDRTIAALHNGMQRTAFALFLAWIVLTCEFGMAGPLKKLLSWKLFQPMSRLSYAIYLTSSGLQYSMASSRLHSYAFSETEIYRDLCGDIVYAVGIAFIFCLLFEAPYVKLANLVFNRNNTTERTVKRRRSGNSQYVLQEAGAVVNNT
ncbi:nose resistant to fluoxetine protein 6-like isoform X2 [Nilaparvata lugens]|uniref:nose resistant to fluoxetine protein 6-like isoform X2 n=1 Tax=Nilaparvata lugens TaxID=108931 RepID=UPI00193D0168|nr:nose resistant to fluoxetine protein 6-like isoform X2 [Nilaparvata lugens]